MLTIFIPRKIVWIPNKVFRHDISFTKVYKHIEMRNSFFTTLFFYNLSLGKFVLLFFESHGKFCVGMYQTYFNILPIFKLLHSFLSFNFTIFGFCVNIFFSKYLWIARVFLFFIYQFAITIFICYLIEFGIFYLGKH